MNEESFSGKVLKTHVVVVYISSFLHGNIIHTMLNIISLYYKMAETSAERYFLQICKFLCQKVRMNGTESLLHMPAVGHKNKKKPMMFEMKKSILSKKNPASKTVV